jgi:hypothetical protein
VPDARPSARDARRQTPEGYLVGHRFSRMSGRTVRGFATIFGMKARTVKAPLLSAGEFLVAALSAALALAGAASLRARQVSAASLGSLDVTVKVAPSEGNAEPARGLTLYLLRRSFEEIRKEADADEPKLDKNAFIEKQDFSPELKAWMKKHQVVDFNTPEFAKAVAADDIINIKELSDAFSSRTNGDMSVELPNAKYQKVDKQKHPDKYKQLMDEYRNQLKQVIEQHPEVISDLHTQLENSNINPGAGWDKLKMEREARVRRRGLQLAEGDYLAGQSITDLNGKCEFASVPPGSYWVSSLEIEASAGDTRVRWDFPVRVAAGQAAAVQLTSLNGITPTQ